MKKNSPAVRLISAIYVCSLLRINNIIHKEIVSGLDGRESFVYDDTTLFNTVAKAFTNDSAFTATVDGVQIIIRARSFARYLQEIKSLIHS